MSRAIGRLLFLGALSVLTAYPAHAQKDKENKEDKERPKREPDLPFVEIRLPAGRPYEAVFSPDGSKVAVAMDAKIHVLNFKDGKEIVSMQLPQAQSFHPIIFSADGKALIWTGSEEKLVRIFDVKTGRQKREFKFPDDASRMAGYSPDATRIVFTGGKNYDFDIHDIDSGKLIVRIENRTYSGSPVFLPSGKQLALRSYGDKGKGTGDAVRIVDAETGALVRTIKDADPRFPCSGFEFLAFSPDGKRMASWGRKNFFDIWELETGKRLCSVQTRLWYHAAHFSRDGNSILSTSSANEAVLHNILLEKTMLRFADPYPSTAVFTPDEKKLVIMAYSSQRDPNKYPYSLYVYDLPRHMIDPPAARAIDDAELSKLWVDLQSDNDLRLQLALKAYRAAPKPAVALIRKELVPVAKERQKQVEAWIAEMDDEDFKRREAAMERVHGVAHEFGPLLVARHKAAEAGEVRNRLTFVLGKKGLEKTPDALVRESRVVALLEQLATPDARQLLSELSQGAPQARLTVEAHAALQRMDRQK